MRGEVRVLVLELGLTLLGCDVVACGAPASGLTRSRCLVHLDEAFLFQDTDVAADCRRCEVKNLRETGGRDWAALDDELQNRVSRAGFWFLNDCHNLLLSLDFFTQQFPCLFT